MLLLKLDSCSPKVKKKKKDGVKYARQQKAVNDLFCIVFIVDSQSRKYLLVINSRLRTRSVFETVMLYMNFWDFYASQAGFL